MMKGMAKRLNGAVVMLRETAKYAVLSKRRSRASSMRLRSAISPSKDSLVSVSVQTFLIFSDHANERGKHECFKAYYTTARKRKETLGLILIGRSPDVFFCAESQFASVSGGNIIPLLRCESISEQHSPL